VQAPTVSPPNAANVPVPSETPVADLTLRNAVAIPASASTVTLSFQNDFVLVNGNEGSVLEVSTDGGSTWLDVNDPTVGGVFLSGGYNGKITNSTNHLFVSGGRPAWTGSSGGFITTSVDLTALKGQSVLLRFRAAGVLNFGGSGAWTID